MAVELWKSGDWVTHVGRPEWGPGQVTAAETLVQNGQKCQRLMVRFDRAGPKTLSTAYADLRASVAGGKSSYSEAKPEEEESMAAAFDLAEMVKALSGVPEAATDPFISLPKRVETTLNLYRFTGTGSSLLDWAAMQTGLRDPLSAFNRHELEQHFQTFRTNVEGHLRKVLRELKRADPASASKLEAAAPAEARNALRRIHTSG